MAGACGRVFVGASRFAPNAPAEHLGGFFRMLEGDSDWTLLSEGLPESPQVRAISIDPNDPTVILAGTQDGPYRSTDGGDSWARTDFPERDREVWTLARHPADADVVFAGTAPAHVYRSDDGGQSWTLLPQAHIDERCDMGFPTRLIAVAVDPTDSQLIYAAVEVGGVMRSTDGGATWEDCTDHLGQLADEQPRLRSQLLSDTHQEGMLDSHALVMSTAAPGRAFLGVRMGIFSTDDGSHWDDVGIERFSPLTYCRDVRVAAHDPRVFYATLSDESLGRTGSVYRSDDAGVNWRRYDDLDPASTIMQVSPHFSDADQVWCATRQGEVFATADGGQSWSPHPLPAGGRDVYALECG